MSRGNRNALRVVIAALVPLVALLVVTRDDEPPRQTWTDVSADGATSTTAAGTGATTTPPTSRPAAAPAPTQAQLNAVKVRWQQVTEVRFPTGVAFRGSPPLMYVAEREGRIRLIKDGRPQDPAALDITDDVGLEGEGGLLSIAFSRDGKTMFVHYTDKKADSRVVAYTMAGDTADPKSKRQLLFLDQPKPVHNGGGLVVDERDHLWVSFGDGGERNAKRRIALDLNSLFGKVIRIDPRPDGDKPYRIPEGNPFAGRDDHRPEVWAYGLRNPWRFTFDRATGDMWIGDVGEHGAEEIDLMKAGQSGLNFGWPAYEGTKVFTRGDVDKAANHTPPLKAIARTGGFCAVTGGYVYRGKAIPSLSGAYVYSDVCTGNVHLLSQQDGKVVAERNLGKLLDQLVSFGEDPDGELYVMSLVGQVWKLVPA